MIWQKWSFRPRFNLEFVEVNLSMIIIKFKIAVTLPSSRPKPKVEIRKNIVNLHYEICRHKK